MLCLIFIVSSAMADLSGGRRWQCFSCSLVLVATERIVVTAAAEFTTGKCETKRVAIFSCSGEDQKSGPQAS